VISSCRARFTADRGSFLGASPDYELALLPEGRVLVDGHDKNGLWLVDPARTARLHAPGDKVYQVAVSPDSARVVTLETTDAKDERTVVVRALPSLQELRRRPLGVGPYSEDDDSVAFLPDGREVALTSYPCVEEACPGAGNQGSGTSTCPPRRCEQRTLFTFDGGAPALLAPDLGNIARAAFAPRRAPRPAAPFAIKPPVGFERLVERDGEMISADVVSAKLTQAQSAFERRCVDFEGGNLHHRGEDAPVAADGVGLSLHAVEPRRPDVVRARATLSLSGPDNEQALGLRERYGPRRPITIVAGGRNGEAMREQVEIRP
jgi:hypothetical protein